MSVTIVSCLYGERGYEQFRPSWEASLEAMTRKPDAVIVTGDGYGGSPCPWLHPQAFYLQQAILAAKTDWVWILDMDDTALPDALEGIDEVEADVWQFGYLRSDGLNYIPPKLSAEEYLAGEGNPFTAGSAIRTESFRRSGGFVDVALQDFALWRALARDGASFLSSDRAHYRYNRHPDTRSATELLPEKRQAQLEEMDAVL